MSITSPKAFCCNIKPGTILPVSCLVDQRSSMIDCSGGSAPSLWQTSLKSSAVIILPSSLWRLEGKPSLKHASILDSNAKDTSCVHYFLSTACIPTSLHSFECFFVLHYVAIEKQHPRMCLHWKLLKHVAWLRGPETNANFACMHTIVDYLCIL